MTACHCLICDGVDYVCASCPGGVLMDLTDAGAECPVCGGTEVDQ